MAVSLEQFIQQIEASGLVAAETLCEFIPPKASPSDAEALAISLIQQKKLTKFQAEQISRGSGKSLVLGNYVLLEKIGAGGMGQVFKARHRRMERFVAVKFLPTEMTKDKKAIARFQREVVAAAKLRHPNIVAADDADESNGVHFLVMEYIDGIDLSAQVKKNGPLSVAQAIECVLQVARGLEFSHREGVIHRDIKPANLLMDNRGTVKVLDMGLARLQGEFGGAAGTELTSTGTVMGTVDYMPPEQALDTKMADARSDIYALGCSLYFLLSGMPPYGGDTVMKKLLAHRDQPLPSLAAACPGVPAWLDAVFRKMVAKNADDRYQTMTEVIRDLETKLAAQTSTIGSPSLAGISQTTASPTAASVELLQQTQKSSAQTVHRTIGTEELDHSLGVTIITTASAEATNPETVTIARSERKRSKSAPGIKNRSSESSVWWKQWRYQVLAGLVPALLLTVLFLQTPKGTLRVEVLDPDVEVRVKGSEVTLNSDSKEPISLQIGEKKLTVTRGDLSFETVAFTLKKGTETVVKVELLDDKLQAVSNGQVLGQATVPTGNQAASKSDRSTTPRKTLTQADPKPAATLIGSQNSSLTVASEPFCKAEDGSEITQYVLRNGRGMKVGLLDRGGILTLVEVPDRHQKVANVILRFAKPEDYLSNSPFFGGICGRYANRIDGATFVLNGSPVKLTKNGGDLHLHGGVENFMKKRWKAEPFQAENQAGVRLNYTSPDGEEGYPGTLQATVTYSISEPNELRIDYVAVTLDKSTVVNLTNHAYWNLSGQPNTTILDHELTLACDRCVAINERLIPTGELLPVSGGYLDFTKLHKIGANIDQTPKGIGYDHCYVVNGPSGPLRPVAHVVERTSGRVMEVRTTEPGIQFYTGNFLDQAAEGRFVKYEGLCLEAQHFPDSPNHPQFPTTTLNPSETYRQTTIYKFWVE